MMKSRTVNGIVVALATWTTTYAFTSSSPSISKITLERSNKCPHRPAADTARSESNDRRKNASSSSLWWSSNSHDLFDSLRRLWDDTFGSVVSKNPSEESSAVGRVVRCAARPHAGRASEPSNRDYTTRKNSLPLIHVTSKGVTGDYNHFRTVSLKSTGDRALSLVTTDASSAVSRDFDLREGDLGENLLVDGLTHASFAPGRRYVLGGDDEESGGRVVEIEITERVVPCASLCRLEAVNREDLAPRQRVERCKDLLRALDAAPDGWRGWYAKIVGEGGVIKVGDSIRPVAAFA